MMLLSKFKRTFLHIGNIASSISNRLVYFHQMLLKYISLQCPANVASGKGKADFHKSFPGFLFLFMSMEHFIWLCETLKRCCDLTKRLTDLHWIKVAFPSDLQDWRGCVTKIGCLKDSTHVLCLPGDPFPSTQVPSKIQSADFVTSIQGIELQQFDFPRQRVA